MAPPEWRDRPGLAGQLGVTKRRKFGAGNISGWEALQTTRISRHLTMQPQQTAEWVLPDENRFRKRFCTARVTRAKICSGVSDHVVSRLL